MYKWMAWWQLSSVLFSRSKLWSFVIQPSSCLIISALLLTYLLCRYVNLSVAFNISIALHCALSNLFIFYLIFAMSPERSIEKKTKRKNTFLPKSHVIKKYVTLSQHVTFQCNFILRILSFICLRPSVFCYVWLQLSWIWLQNCNTSKTAGVNKSSVSSADPDTPSRLSLTFLSHIGHYIKISKQ